MVRFLRGEDEEINPPTVLSDETEVDYEGSCFARTV
jgi:hypothetical protein